MARFGEGDSGREGWPVNGPGGSGLSRKAIMEQIDGSPTRLGTDYIESCTRSARRPGFDRPCAGPTPCSQCCNPDFTRLKKAGPIMNSWNEDDLRAIAESHDLYISPFREDGTTYGTPTLVWPLVVDGEVFVRAANGQQSSWYVAALSQKAGRIRVGGKDYEVTFEPGGNETASAIDAAYEEKYKGSSAVPIMQREGPKSATVRISPH